MVEIGDSKDPDGPTLTFSPKEFDDFVDDLQSSRLDLA
jgi:hypothetical protein